MASRFSVEAIFSAVDKMTAPMKKMQSSSNALARSMGGDFAKAQKKVDGMISSINVYYPGPQERPSENVMAARITLSVDFFENTLENTFPTLDVLQTSCVSSETGETYFDGDLLQTGD